VRTLGLAAARTQPPAPTAPHTHCIGKKRAAKRAPSEACAHAGRTMHGKCGSADRRGA